MSASRDTRSMRGTTKIDQEIGTRLRQARLAKRLTQDGLGKLIGISFQQIQKYENGSNRIAASRLYLLAEVLGIPVTYFFDELGRVPATALQTGTKADGAGGLPDRVIRVARDLNEMPEGPQRDALFGLIKTMGRKGTMRRRQAVTP